VTRGERAPAAAFDHGLIIIEPKSIDFAVGEGIICTGQFI
jgi:hypothetical protein